MIMKNQILVCLLALISVLSLKAQIYGTIEGVSSNNNVGIGTNNPNATLQIGESDGSGSPSSEIEVKRLSLAPITHSGSDWFFTTRDNNPYANLDIGYSNFKALTVRHDGNVGIGASMPTDKLSVSAGAVTVGFGNNDKATLQGGSGFGSLLRLYYADGTETVRLDAGGGGGTSWINSGNVLIGKTSQVNSAYKLDVNGTIRAKEIKVNLDGADFVFEKDYKLMPLNELEEFVKKQKHLPEIAPAKKMEEDGADLGNLNSKLLQKMEEMTLYIIEQNKRLDQQNQELKVLKEEIEKLKKP